MRLKKITLREIHLPLIAPFQTSFGETSLRRILLVEADVDGVSGWGESTAGEDPFYSYETVETAWHITRGYLWPILKDKEMGAAREVWDLLARVRGHNMAKGGLEAAIWDAEAKQKNLPLAKLLGGVREEVSCGVSIGIQPTIKELIAKVEKELAAGYQRIKIKIKPGMDVEPARALRERFPRIRLMVDANSVYRLEDARLLTGQVDWIEAPSPDAIDRLKSAGMKIVTRVYPHNWSYQLNFVKGPFADKRVRQAANYALNREDMKDLLNGLMLEQYATVTPSTAYYGSPVLYKYDPAKAKALLKEAGCLPCKVTFAISTSGSGQMQPLPMNELVKSQLDAAGFEVTLNSMDWNALLQVGRGGVDASPDISAINISRAAQDPFNALIRHVWTGAWAPKGANWGHHGNPAMDKLIEDILAEFDTAKRLALLTKLHEMMSEEAALIFVAHDLNPRAMSPKVKGFVQAQSWFQDLTPVTVTP